MQFHFDLMQIYNAIRPTKPQNYFIYTHQSTKEFYIHIYVSQIQTQELKKSLTGLPNNTVSLQNRNTCTMCIISTCKWEEGHARGEKSKEKSQNIKCCSCCVCLCVGVFRSPVCNQRVIFS